MEYFTKIIYNSNKLKFNMREKGDQDRANPETKRVLQLTILKLKKKLGVNKYKNGWTFS